jgi:hypothetical protein
MNYRTYPVDYIQQLKRERGARGRKKARAFMEYWDDMEHGDHNSEGFYAESWEVSRSTSHGWIKEFRKEIDLFLDHWYLKNMQHYSYAEKSTEQNEQVQPSKTSTLEHRKAGLYNNTTEQNEQVQPREVFNSNDNDYKGGMSFSNDPKFNDLFFIYAQNTKHPGHKEKAYAAYVNSKVDASMLTLAAVQYLHDPAVGDRRFNLTNFIMNEAYIPYLPKIIRVKHGDNVIEGEYIEEKSGVFRDGKLVAELTPSRLVELYKVGSLEFVNQLRKVS